MASLLLSNLPKQPFPLAPLFSQASYCQLPPIRSLPAQIEQAEQVAQSYFPGADFKRPSLLGEVRESGAKYSLNLLVIFQMFLMYKY